MQVSLLPITLDLNDYVFVFLLLSVYWIMKITVHYAKTGEFVKREVQVRSGEKLPTTREPNPYTDITMQPIRVVTKERPEQRGVRRVVHTIIITVSGTEKGAVQIKP